MYIKRNVFFSKVRRIVSYTVLILGAISSVLTIISFFTYSINLPNCISWLIIFAIFGMVAAAIILIYQTQKPVSERVEKLSVGFERITHSYSNAINTFYYKATNCTDKNDLFYEILNECHYINRELNDILTEVLGEKTRTCIKLLHENEPGKQIEYLYTFCRDDLHPHISQQREHKEKIPINENTDFNSIYYGGKNYFIGNTLKKDYLNGKYLNSSNTFEYNSAYVIPICEEYFKRGCRGPALSDIVGFLCVDSNKENVFYTELSELCMNLVNATSNLLYLYLNTTFAIYNKM